MNSRMTIPTAAGLVSIGLMVAIPGAAPGTPRSPVDPASPVSSPSLPATPPPDSLQRGLAPAVKSEIEERGARFIRAVNQNDPDQAAGTVREVFADATIAQVGQDRLVALIGKIRSGFGELEFHHAELTEFDMGDRVSRVLHVYAKPRGGKAWQDLQFRIEPNPPYKLIELAFIAEVSEPVALPNGPISDTGTVRWLSQYVDKLVADNDLSGSILIAKDESPVFERTFGFADARRTRSISPDTRFNLGSGSKMFTAIAVAQLAEKGKLSYSDPLVKFFPELMDSAFARTVTVHHLLSHTSGIGEYWTDEYERQWHTITSLDRMLPWVLKAGVKFAPGSRCEYSNSNFALAGVIVERVSGEDYYSYVHTHIVRPLGLTGTDFYYHRSTDAPLAEPQKRGPGGWEVAAQGLRGTSAGGAYSTARDMLTFVRGLAGGRLVQPQTLTLLTTSKTAGVPGELRYGYGFVLSGDGNARSWGHGGLASGVNFELRYFPSEDLTFVLFCNQDNGAFDDLRKNTIKLITGER